MPSTLNNKILLQIFKAANYEGLTELKWADGEVIRVRHSRAISASESRQDCEEVEVDVMQIVVPGKRSQSVFKQGRPGTISEKDLPSYVSTVLTAKDIAKQILEQLQTGNIWHNDHDYTENYEGLQHALRNSGCDRPPFTAAIYDCLTNPSPLVRSGAIALVSEVAIEIGVDRLADLARNSPNSFCDADKPGQTSEDLEQKFVMALLSFIQPQHQIAIAYIKEIATERAWGAYVLGCLARVDPKWILAHPQFVPHDNMAVLFALNQDQRKQLVKALAPYPPEPTEPAWAVQIRQSAWKKFSEEDAKELRLLMWPR